MDAMQDVKPSGEYIPILASTTKLHYPECIFKTGKKEHLSLDIKTVQKNMRFVKKKINKVECNNKGRSNNLK